MSDAKPTVKIEDAQLIFRNFAGKESQYNREGDRNFCVLLDDETGAVMERDGWNVRYLDPRDEGDTPTPYLPVSVNFKNRPPRVTMITSSARTTLTEETVEALDWVDIRNADLIVRAYNWTVNGKSGIKAYLQTLFVIVEEDDLERKYAVVDGDD